MTKFEKAQKNLKHDVLTLFILDLLVIIFSLVFPSVGNTVEFYDYFFVAFLFGFYICAKKGIKSAGIVGIIFGVLMMLTIFSRDILDFLVGLFLLIDSLKYIKSSKEK